MANQYAARLGVLLGIDTAEFSSGVDKAVSETRKLKRSIESEMRNAEKEIQRLKYATEDYGKEITAVTLMQRQLSEGGRYANLAKSSSTFSAAMLKEAAALDAVREANKKLNASRGGSAGMDRYLKQALAYQTTDIVTSLAGGQNPMMVLLQQGGQLRDQFGGFKPLFAGIASSVTLAGTAMVTTGAALGGLAYAAYQGSKDFAKFRDDLILTNNYAGVTASSFDKLATSLSDKLNISVGDTKDIFSALVASGAVTKNNLEGIASVIGKVSMLTGEAADTVAQRLLPSFDGTSASAQKLNNQYHFLTLAQYKQIEALERQGKVQEAAHLTADLLNESLNTQARNLGYLEKGWIGVTNGLSAFWNKLKDIGKEDTTQQAIDKIDAKIRSLQGRNEFGESETARKMRLDQALADKKLLVDKLAAEDAKAAEAEKLAKQKRDIDLYKGAGGAEKAASYQAEFEKLKADEVFQAKMFNATEMEKIQLESEKRITDKRVELAKASQTEIGQFSGAQAKIMAQFEANEKLKVAQEIQKINREEFKAVNEKQITERDSLDMEKQKMGIYQSNFFITEQEAKIAEQRLATEQAIAKIMRDEKLTPESKERLIEQQKAIGNAKEELISFSEKLQYVKDMNSAVFSSMTTAIEAFVLTGKFSFENFVKSILASFVKIQAEWMALSMMRGLGSVFGGLNIGTAAQYGTNVGSQQTAMLAAQDAGLTAFASGGTITGPSIVGENGPELFIPSGSGTIIPNQRMNDYGGGQAQNVFNGPYIANMQAIDTQSGVQFLAKNKMAVWSANQSAARSLPTSR